MKIYSITNQKGGVGKSTTAQALAAGLAKAGKKVLVIDLDAQGNTSYSMAADMTKPNVYDLMKYRHTLQECIQPTAIDNLFIIAGGQDLVSIETELTTTGKEYRLKELIGKAKFDAGDGQKGGNLGFYHKNGQGDGGQQPQQYQFFDFHALTAFH